VATPILGEHDVWLAGLPRHDVLLADVLPSDLADAETRLRERLDGRWLVLLTGDAAWSPDDVTRLGAWAHDAGVVIGVREGRPDAPTGLTRTFASLAPLGLSDRSVMSEAVVLRASSAVISDSTAGLLDARAAGHPLLVHPPGRPLDALLDELETLAGSDWTTDPGPVPLPETVALDGDAARRFAHRVRLRELARLQG
jgi:hypothetical protein